MSMADDIEDFRAGLESAPLCAEIARLKEELAKAQAALGDAQADLRAVKCGHATPKEARLERELAKAQAENARLVEERNQAIQLQAMAQSDRARMEAAYGELRLLRCCVHDDMPGLLVQIEEHLASLHERATGMSLEESDMLGRALLACLRAAREGK